MTCSLVDFGVRVTELIVDPRGRILALTRVTLCRVVIQKHKPHKKGSLTWNTSTRKIVPGFLIVSGLALFSRC